MVIDAVHAGCLIEFGNCHERRTERLQEAGA
jgi:hypothetical protein